MPTVEDVVRLLGGPDAAASRCGVGTEAVRKWRQAQAIPARHWPAVIAATGFPLSDMPGATPGAAPPTLETAPMPDPEDSVPEGATAALVLGDGSVFWGRGFGARRTTVGEVCFNTGMTGYQETLTDPSYAGQIITFTFPHIGNVGANPEDMEAVSPVALGLVVKQDVTEPANWRATRHLDNWLRSHDVPGIAGLDTRALTVLIRDGGPPHGVLSHPADGRFDLPALRRRRGSGRGWRGWTSRARCPAGRPTAGTRPPGPGAAGSASRRRRGAAWWRWTTGPSATSSAPSPRPAWT
jgi:carbamoyl-phosphate synthase small subunit